MDKIASLGLPREIPFPQRNTPQIIDNTQMEKGRSFGETITDFIQDVDDIQKFADHQVERFATGNLKDIHEVMIAAQQANLSFQLMVEIRNKVMESYRELMRMQV